MGKSASREDRGKRSSFSVSYEGGGQRDPSTQVKLGRLSYKGPATVAIALVAASGVVAYQWLGGQGDTGGTGAGPGTQVTSSADAPTGTSTATAATGTTTAPASATSGPPASPSASPPGSAAARLRRPPATRVRRWCGNTARWCCGPRPTWTWTSPRGSPTSPSPCRRTTPATAGPSAATAATSPPSTRHRRGPGDRRELRGGHRLRVHHRSEEHQQGTHRVRAHRREPGGRHHRPRLAEGR